MLDINLVLTKIARKRPVFHSEADFQHALAWEIHEIWAGCAIRLEYRQPHLRERLYTDIWATREGRQVAIELKYKTRRLQVEIGREVFDLLDQSAQDIARYDFLKDVARLERTLGSDASQVGFAILLTNDSAYWKQARDERSIDVQFRLDEGSTIQGTLEWRPGASAGTMKNRETPIMIGGRYTLRWQDYSEPSAESRGKLRYLLVEVRPAQIRKHEVGNSQE